MNITCDIVMDLFPLYKDGLASSDSVKEIRKHLQKCEDCRTFYRRYNYQSKITNRFSKNKPDTSSDYGAIAKRLRIHHLWKTTIVLSFTIICAAVALLSYLSSNKDDVN